MLPILFLRNTAIISLIYLLCYCFAKNTFYMYNNLLC